MELLLQWISLSVFLFRQFFFFSWQFSHIHPRKGALRRLSKVACFSGDLTLLRRTTHFVRQFLRHELSTLFFSRRETAKWITTTLLCAVLVYSLAAPSNYIESYKFKIFLEFRILNSCSKIRSQWSRAIITIVVRKLPNYLHKKCCWW